jgi:hypothetical protein
MNNTLPLAIVGSMTHSIATYDNEVKERFGGGVYYGGKAAASLEIPATIFTIGAADLEPGLEDLRKFGIKTERIARNVSNNFSNDYRNGKRKLQIRSYFTKPFSSDDFTEKIKADAVVFFPGLSEISGQTISAFDTKIVFLDIGGLTRILGEKNEEGLYPIIQSDWKSIAEFCGKVDILKVSHEDLENIKFPNGVNSEEEKVQNLAENGFPIVLFTRGEKPTILARKDLPLLEISTYKVDCGDPAGAGEVFSIGFIYNYLQSNDPVISTAFGNACASFKIAGIDYNYDMAKKRAEELLK